MMQNVFPQMFCDSQLNRISPHCSMSHEGFFLPWRQDAGGTFTFSGRRWWKISRATRSHSLSSSMISCISPAFPSSHTSPLYSYPSGNLDWLNLIFSAASAALMLKAIWEKSLLTAGGGFQILEKSSMTHQANSFCEGRWWTPDGISPEFTLRCAFSVNVDGCYINTEALSQKTGFLY